MIFNMEYPKSTGTWHGYILNLVSLMLHIYGFFFFLGRAYLVESHAKIASDIILIWMLYLFFSISHYMFRMQYLAIRYSHYYLRRRNILSKFCCCYCTPFWCGQVFQHNFTTMLKHQERLRFIQKKWIILDLKAAPVQLQREEFVFLGGLRRVIWWVS